MCKNHFFHLLSTNLFLVFVIYKDEFNTILFSFQERFFSWRRRSVMRSRAITCYKLYNINVGIIELFLARVPLRFSKKLNKFSSTLLLLVSFHDVNWNFLISKKTNTNTHNLQLFCFKTNPSFSNPSTNCNSGVHTNRSYQRSEEKNFSREGR